MTLREYILSESSEMDKIVEKDNNAKLEEFKNRLGNMLKFEYEELESVKDTPMTKELGENLRYQMYNIFSQIEKMGVRIK